MVAAHPAGHVGGVLDSDGGLPVVRDPALLPRAPLALRRAGQPSRCVTDRLSITSVVNCSMDARRLGAGC